MNTDPSKNSSHFAKTICSICYEDLKPTVEDLQSISICGHVFHDIWFSFSLTAPPLFAFINLNHISAFFFFLLIAISFPLSLQQWLEYAPSGKKSSCPVCKQPCSHKTVCRLYFQSIGGEPTQSASSVQPSDAADIYELREELKRLQFKLSSVSSTSELQQQHINELNAELLSYREQARKEELLKEEVLKENACLRELLQNTIEELTRTSSECSRLKDRSMALAKELAALKLVSEVNLEEEEVVKLASISGGSDKEQTIDILTRSLVLRNKSYRGLMAQCNLLGRGESRSLKKLEKAEEKITKLRRRLQELERAIEEKDNEGLRAMRTSSRTTAEIVHQKDEKETSNSSFVGKCTLEDKMGKTAGFVLNSKIHFGFKDTSPCIKTTRDISENQKGSDAVNVKDTYDDIIDLDLEMDPLFSLDEDVAKFSSITHDSGVHTYPSTDLGKNNVLNRATDDLMLKTCRNASAGIMLPDVIMEDVPLPVKQLSSGGVENVDPSECQQLPCGLLKPQVNRYVGKWCRRAQNKVASSTSGDLIAVGADGRGGKIKVLRSQSHLWEGTKGNSTCPKRCKYGAKESGQSQGCLQIEHFFTKKGS